MARRKRHQLSLLQENPPETRPLFNSTEFPYDTPDEIAYNARRKAEGLFVLIPEEEKIADTTEGEKHDANRR